MKKIIILSFLGLLSCSNQVNPTPTNSSGIANPASQFCIQQGGTLEIKDSSAGQTGVCTFADKSTCEEWAFFRGECKKGDSSQTKK